MTKELIHSVILIITILLTFIFPKTSLAQYDLQISALLFIILYLSKKFLAKSASQSSRLIESVVFTLIILLIVNSTGGVNSVFFFLIYFLLFSLSLLLEPVISITTTVTLIICFLLSLPPNQSFSTLLPIFSLAFLTPFALFMGQEFIELQKSKRQNQQLQEDTFLFLSLMIKNHLRVINKALENFMGDHELNTIKKQVENMKRLIDKYERSKT
ncbi:MAG: hypothetical protein QHH09_00260 [Microgenomates group bacterium]|nr:hypothetical protein [Microgenomates group bacterium]